MDENDELDFVASEHDRLVNAITKLDKTQHISQPTRNEPTNVNSEFNLVKNSNKIQLDHVAKVLENTAYHAKIGKKLKEIQKPAKILSKPLEKPQAERIKRAAGYQQAKTKLGRWDPVVSRNRTVDFVSFPLKTASTKLQLTNDFLSKLKLKSPLEQELEEIDPPPTLDEEEEDQKYPMSYEEMLEHRKNLAKLRAQQSYKAAKGKRQGKIKSKKYHRILKKERLKNQLKEFEELQLKNPEEALKKLEELEKARALERHTLRHKNTGKWAKSKLVRAKYDKEVRQQLAEQLSVSRGLTHKTQDTESTDEEGENENIPDVNLDQDPSNPWMVKRSDKPNVDAEFDFGYKKYLKDKMYKQKESDSESEEEQVENGNNKTKITFASLKESIQKLAKDDNNEEEIANDNLEDENIVKKANKVPKREKKESNSITATSSWTVESIENVQNKNSLEDVTSAFESFETKVSDKVNKKLDKLRKQIDNLDKGKVKKQKPKKSKANEKPDSIEYLKLRNQKVKAVIDEGLIETDKKVPDVINDKKSLSKLSSIPLKKDETSNNNMDIDPNRFIEVKPKYLNTALPSAVNEVDDLDDDEQVVPKVDIEEVFEEDDVVASFRQEKEDERNKDKLEDIDLTLPGWGSWGGKGVKAPKRKRNRFITKRAPKFPRRDDNKGDVIINEYKDPKLSTHRVADLPFPFTSVKEYEASIRAPIGNTFIPEQAHRKLIRPSLITKAGTVIEPMDEDELLVKRNLTFNNDSVMKMLAKK